MSVLIDMEMPTSCLECRLYNDPWCMAKNVSQWRTAYNRPPKGERQNDCPLISVPPHGRLIDADALMKILSKVIDINASIEQRNEATDQERRCLWWFEQQIGIAPTIIPAEEGET